MEKDNNNVTFVTRVFIAVRARAPFFTVHFSFLILHDVQHDALFFIICTATIYLLHYDVYAYLFVTMYLHHILLQLHEYILYYHFY